MRKLAIILIVMGPLLAYSQIPTHGLVGYWPFNGNANDESGNGNNGSVYGATLVQDRYGNENSAYFFDGDDYIKTIFPGPCGDTSRSISFWATTEGENINASILSYGNPNASGAYHGLKYTVISNTDCIGVGVCRTNGFFIKPTGIYQSLEWHHYCILYNRSIGNSIGNISVYMDGQLISQSYCASYNLEGDINTSYIDPIYIARNNTLSTSSFFTGKIDDIRIYNIALNQDDVTALYYEFLGVSVIQQPESQIVCKGDFVNFNVNASGEEPIFYQWQKNNENIPNATGNIFSLSNVQLSDEGEYRCIVSNNNGSDTSNAATLTVDVVPTADIFGPPSVYEWQVATYSVTPQGGHQYDFWVDGGNILQNNSNNIEVQWGAVGYGHVYMLETNVSGCMSDTNSLQVAIGSVGINSISDNESISAYPQPANEKLFINLLSNNYNLLHIADLKGNVLIEQDICSEKEVVSIESLSPGVYILSISNQFERVVKKFVKM